MIREAIAKLMNKEDLTYDEAIGVMEEMMDGTATQAQMWIPDSTFHAGRDNRRNHSICNRNERKRSKDHSGKRSHRYRGNRRGVSWDIQHLDNIRICRSSRWRAGCKTRQPERIKQSGAADVTGKLGIM